MGPIESVTSFEMDFYAKVRGKHVQIVGPKGGELMLLEPEDAMKLAHDIMAIAEEVLKRLPQESTLTE